MNVDTSDQKLVETPIQLLQDKIDVILARELELSSWSQKQENRDKYGARLNAWDDFRNKITNLKENSMWASDPMSLFSEVMSERPVEW